MRPGLPELEEREEGVEALDATDLDYGQEPTYEEIAAEAYARYLSRGRVDGGDVSDWLEAEQTLRRRRLGDQI
jgi:Protein of unknown function (DUF2934)